MQRFIMAASVLFGLALGLLVVGPTSVSAGAGNANCDDFASQFDAQRFFQDNGGSPTNNVAGLDDDNDGIACDTFFGGGSVIVDGPVDGGPPVVDPVTCGNFDTQADAQAFLDASQGDAAILDPDGDGFACEFRFGEVGAPVTVDPSPMGAESVTGGTTTSGSGTTTSLPSTGSGSTASSSITMTTAMLVLFAGAAIALGTFGLVRNRRA